MDETLLPADAGATLHIAFELTETEMCGNPGRPPYTGIRLPNGVCLR